MSDDTRAAAFAELRAAKAEHEEAWQALRLVDEEMARLAKERHRLAYQAVASANNRIGKALNRLSPFLEPEERKKGTSGLSA